VTKNTGVVVGIVRDLNDPAGQGRIQLNFRRLGSEELLYEYLV